MVHICWVMNRPTKFNECYDCHTMSCPINVGQVAGDKLVKEEKDVEETTFLSTGLERPRVGTRLLLKRLDNGEDIYTNPIISVVQKCDTLFEINSEKNTYYVIYDKDKKIDVNYHH